MEKEVLSLVRTEELIKYSKGSYDKELFINELRNKWLLTDIQIRMAYLIADLSETAEGVFSIKYQTFIKMYEERFKSTISLSSVRRNFALFQELGVLSIHEGKRKNNKRGSNIYIIEPIEVIEQVNEHAPEHVEEHVNEHANEHAGEHLHEPTYNITLNNSLNNSLNITTKTTSESTNKSSSRSNTDRSNTDDQERRDRLQKQLRVIQLKYQSKKSIGDG